jgi:hypothetical protein
MKELIALVGLLFCALVYYALNHESVSGVTLAHEAASEYCHIVELEKSSFANESARKDLPELKLNLTGSLNRADALNEDERADFIRTYSLMVSHCK